MLGQLIPFVRISAGPSFFTACFFIPSCILSPDDMNPMWAENDKDGSLQGKPNPFNTVRNSAREVGGMDNPNSASDFCV
ncbi:MAG: hypothetical protein J2P31_17590 [Blastocatellia bacterium]|nr:hypothetical protein [Blastocatellia bacterium]